ncbi:MAG: AMP-binding protein [Actinomycetota bacterium]
MARLVAIDQAGGPAFVDELERVWAAGDAAFPVDQRLPPARRADLCIAMRVGEEVDDGDALIVATSGSTGRPKGVVLTHDAVAASARATSAALDVADDDHWLACLPLSHVGGLSVLTRALLTSTPVTVMPGFDAAEVMRAVDIGATLVSLVPTVLARIEPSRFRRIVIGGTRPPSDLPANAVTTYGMTETGSGVVYDGRPLDGVDVHLDDAGGIHLRAPMLLRCYRDGTVPIDADGWFATGDVGRWVEGNDGPRLHVDGRRGDLIISGGENIWPDAVEALIATHPDVAEVMVRGTDDPEWGQLVEAVVVPVDRARPPSLDDLRHHVRATDAAYMAPRRLTLATALPRTALGKLRRS